MANFPALKTGAVAQYPSDRTRNFRRRCFGFWMEASRDFRRYGASLRQWVIRLDLLDESELRTLEQFFVSEGGRAGMFSFTDPWDGDGVSELQLRHADDRICARGFQGAAAMATRTTSGWMKENRSKMLVFPQFVTGASALYPVTRKTDSADGGEYAGRWEHGGLRRSGRGGDGMGSCTRQG